MTTFALSDEQADALLSVLQSSLGDLHTEISHTDDPLLRKRLHDRYDRILEIVELVSTDRVMRR